MKPNITFPDFDKLDIRVGTITSASAPDWSNKLLRFEVDFGSEIGSRVILSGIKQWYAPEDFESKQFVFLINLDPKKMGPDESQGMMLMADGDKPIPLVLQEKAVNGDVVR